MLEASEALDGPRLLYLSGLGDPAVPLGLGVSGALDVASS